MNLKISEEFKNKIPPLTEDEFKQLRDNIVADGEVYEPIVVWNGVIVDGHNRWKIIQEHPEIPYRVKEIDFSDKWAAFEWMYKKQLGRRNLTDEQKTLLAGKMYEARKKSVGAQEGHEGRNQHTTANSDKMSTLATRREIKDGTAGEIGKEIGMGARSVRRAEKFAHGIDALTAVSPKAAEIVLAGKANISKGDVAELAKKNEKEIKAVAKAIENGQSLKATTFPSGAVSKPKEDDQMKPVISRDRDAPPPEYTLDDLLEELRAVNEDYIRKCRIIIGHHKQMIQDNAAEVSTVFHEVITELEKMEEF